MPKIQKQKELDKETKQIDREGMELEGMINSEGWKIARKKIIIKIADLYNINSVDVLNAQPENIVAIIGAKKTAADILISFIKEIEGTVEQYKGNKELLQEVDEEFILNQERG